MSLRAVSSDAEPDDTGGGLSEVARHFLARGKLTEAGLDRALRSAAETEGRFVHVLSRLGLLAEPDLVKELSTFYRVPTVSKAGFPSAPLFADIVNRSFLLHHRVLLLSKESDGVAIAMADPGDDAAARALEFACGRPIHRKVASLTDIEAAIQQLYGDAESPGRTAAETASGGGTEEDIDRLADLASDAPVIRLVHGLIAQAVEMRASDIHIEPFDDRVRIRFRLDGVLREGETQPRELAGAIASRIKVMAQLDIAERRKPQDGRIRFTVRGKPVDIRVSCSPTVHGESIALRILDRGNLALDFGALGFDDAGHAALVKLLRQPHGIILVTGPTGSGKTTTLYAALQALNSTEKKILTIEDPVEYQLDGINQQAVLPQIGRSFAGALRAFLRQDPNIIMIGEIRDGETAQVAVQAALTGHLILSTLHTNNAASAMTRLLDMGVEDYLLTSTIIGVLSQRLVRRLCPACREAYTPLPDLAQKLFPDGKPASLRLYRARGCEACHGIGYAGRTMLAEMLEVDDAIRRLVLSKAEAREIERAATSKGMRTMYQHGLTRALAGETSLEEVLRVTQEA